MTNIKRVSVSEARGNIAKIVDQAYLEGVDFEITKRNIPLAWIIGSEKLQRIFGKVKRPSHVKDLVKEAARIQAQGKKLSVSTSALVRQARSIREELYG